MRRIFYMFLAFALLFAAPERGMAASSGPARDGVDVKGVIFGHIQDSYEWHLATIGGRHIAISLPVILYSERTGWEFFSSSVFHENSEYKGFRIAGEGKNEGRIVESDIYGSEVRPLLDISITKTVASVLMTGLLLVVIVLYTARWYRRYDVTKETPKGFVGVMEILIEMLLDDVIKPNVGRRYRKYAPYLLTLFFFIFLSNLMGLLPLFPGGANVTGNIAVTLALALCTFAAVNLFGNREYYREVFWPDVPVWLKVPVPLMPAIEIFSMFVKPFALTIRLFANILAGHTALLAFVSIIFITMSVNVYIGSGMTVVSVIFTIFMNVLELLVAFVQAFVFTMLSSVFIGLSQPEHKAGSH